MDRVMLTVEKYGNMSAATVPVALVEALEGGRVQPESWLLMPAFGGGLTYCSLLVKWGHRSHLRLTSLNSACGGGRQS